MYRIRLHGRGGQGVKTAGRILGSALFAAGFEVQDAPRYGAERRGAPISAYVRADRATIHERGVIGQPGLVVVIDETLLSVPAAGALEGAGERTVLLLNAAPGRGGVAWPGRVVLMPELGALAARGGMPLVAAACAGAAARLTGAVPGEALRRAVTEELAALDPAVVADNLELALSAYHRMDAFTGIVEEARPPDLERLAHPHWIELPAVDLAHAVPVIFQGATSAQAGTGLWRTERPVIDPALCRRCWWVCSTFCPDGVIRADGDGMPQIDYDHCKGCLVCLAQCPSHAIAAVPEHDGARRAVPGGISCAG